MAEDNSAERCVENSRDKSSEVESSALQQEAQQCRESGGAGSGADNFRQSQEDSTTLQNSGTLPNLEIEGSKSADSKRAPSDSTLSPGKQSDSGNQPGGSKLEGANNAKVDSQTEMLSGFELHDGGKTVAGAESRKSLDAPGNNETAHDRTLQSQQEQQARESTLGRLEAGEKTRNGQEQNSELQLPSIHDLQTLPVSQLQQTADQNQARLEQMVAANMDNLQYTGFHGAGTEKMRQFVSAQSSVEGYSGSRETYMGAVGQQEHDPKSLLSDLSNAAKQATKYQNPTNEAGAGGGIAVMDLSSFAKKTGTLSGDFETYPSGRPLAHGFAQSSKAGEYASRISPSEFPDVVKGVVSPEKIDRRKGAIQDPMSSPEAWQRHLLGEQFDQQELLSEAIKLRGGRRH